MATGTYPSVQYYMGSLQALWLWRFSLQGGALRSRKYALKRIDNDFSVWSPPFPFPPTHPPPIHILIMLRTTLSPSVISFLFFSRSSCQDVIFLYPAAVQNDLSFARGDTVNVSWQNEYRNPVLILWCTGPDMRQMNLFKVSGTSLEANNWHLVPLASPIEDASNRCHLELKPRAQEGENSVDFEITANEDNSTPTTWGLDQPTETASSSTITTSSTATTTPSTASNATTSSSTTPSAISAQVETSSGLSTGAIVGIVLGIGLAVIIIGTAVFWINRKGKSAGIKEQGMKENHHNQPFKQELPAWNTGPNPRPISEIDGTAVAELSASMAVAGSNRR